MYYLCKTLKSILYLDFELKHLDLNVLFIFQKAMKDKDIDIRELRRYHSEIGPKDEPGHKN